MSAGPGSTPERTGGGTSGDDAEEETEKKDAQGGGSRRPPDTVPPEERPEEPKRQPVEQPRPIPRSVRAGTRVPRRQPPADSTDEAAGGGASGAGGGSRRPRALNTGTGATAGDETDPGFFDTLRRDPAEGLRDLAFRTGEGDSVTSKELTKAAGSVFFEGGPVDLPGAEFGTAEVDEDVVEDLTGSGGFVSESDERAFIERSRRQSEAFREDVVDPFAEGVGDVTGSPAAEKFVRGAGEAFNPGQIPLFKAAGETAVETGQNLPTALAENDPGEVVATGLGVTGAVGKGIASDVVENPFKTAGELTAGLGAGKVASSAIGRGVRFGRDRLRTAGGERVDFEDLTQESVVRNVETGGAEGDEFPGAQDPEALADDPAAAIEEQAEDFTPPNIEDRFPDSEQGAILKKALDVEPEGPGSGRAAQGFTAPDETLSDFSYEAPGAFFGPELSPNFLRTGGGERSFSLKPGLPDFGDNPTGVLAQIDVENPRADSLEEFQEELIKRSGEPTALSKPRGEVNPGEIEAVVPPGSPFRDVGGGPVRQTARKLGIGADFFTEVGGRRVPLRPVVPDTDTDGSTVDDLADEVGDAENPAFSGESIDDLVRAPTDASDDALPLSGFAPDAVTGDGGDSTDTRGDRDRSGRPPAAGSGASGPSGGEGTGTGAEGTEFFSPSGFFGSPGGSGGPADDTPPSSPPTDPFSPPPSSGPPSPPPTDPFEPASSSRTPPPGEGDRSLVPGSPPGSPFTPPSTPPGRSRFFDPFEPAPERRRQGEGLVASSEVFASGIEDISREEFEELFGGGDRDEDEPAFFGGPDLEDELDELGF